MSYKDLRALLEFEGMLGTAKLIVQSALLRTESRGSHQRTDYPKTSARWARHIVLEKGKKPAFSRTAGLSKPYSTFAVLGAKYKRIDLRFRGENKCGRTNEWEQTAHPQEPNIKS